MVGVRFCCFWVSQPRRKSQGTVNDGTNKGVEAVGRDVFGPRS